MLNHSKSSLPASSLPASSLPASSLEGLFYPQPNPGGFMVDSKNKQFKKADNPPKIKKTHLKKHLPPLIQFKKVKKTIK
jgi:hypothetical protein